MCLGSRLHLPFWDPNCFLIINYFNFISLIICLLVNSFMTAVLPQKTVKKTKEKERKKEQ